MGVTFMNGARAITVQHDVWIHGSEAKNFIMIHFVHMS